MTEGLDIDTLATAIADKLHKMAPIEFVLWDGNECANYLRIAPRQFKERTAQLSKFPSPIRLPTGGNHMGNPKWYAQEVMNWTVKQRA